MNSKNLLNLSDPDASIYRIFSKNLFLRLLEIGKNGLVHPSNWDDPFENFFLRSTVIGPGGEQISLDSVAANWYGQCWTFHEETDAMWRIYSPEKNGVKVKTTIRKLFTSFYDATDDFASLKFLAGQVHYHTENEIIDLMQKITFQDIAYGGQSHKFANLLCIKREAFSHEKELRLLFQDVDPKRAANGIALFELDVNTVFDEVVLDPRLTDAEASSLEDEIMKAGCKLPLSRSTLYRVPHFTIPLQ